MNEADYDPIVQAMYATADQIDAAVLREPDHASKVAMLSVYAGLRTFAIIFQQLVMDGEHKYVPESEHQLLRNRWNAKVAEQRSESHD